MSTEPHDKPQESTNAFLRLVDPRMPLPWVVAVIVVAAGMYFQLQALKEAVVDLQITVKAGNQSWAGLSSEQSLLKFRTANNEEEIKALKSAITALQQRR